MQATADAVRSGAAAGRRPGLRIGSKCQWSLTDRHQSLRIMIPTLCKVRLDDLSFFDAAHASMLAAKSGLEFKGDVRVNYFARS